MRIARGVAAAALVLAIVLIAVLLFRGGDDPRVRPGVPERRPARQGRRRPGRRPPHRLGPRDHAHGRQPGARASVEVEEPYAPLREGTTAVIRLTSLSGIANRYIALTPAPNSAKELDDGATLPAGSTTDVVDLDQLFNTLDPKARKDLQGVIQGFATQYDGRARRPGESAEYFNPFLSTSRRLVNQLTQDEAALTDFIVNSSRAVTAVAEKRDDLASLVGNTNTTAARDRRRERRARAGARAAADHAAARQHDVRQPARDARRPRRAGRRVQAGDQGPRAVPARAAPARAQRAPDDQGPAQAGHARRARTTTCSTRRARCRSCRRSPARRSSTRAQALQKSQPVLEFIRPYTPEITGWFHDFGQGTANYDANGHFARIQPIFNAFSFDDNPAGGVLRPHGPQPEVRRAPDQRRQALPGRRQPAGRRRLRALHRQRQPRRRRLRPQPGAPRPLMKRVATVLLLLALAAAAVRDHRRGRGRLLQGARDLRQRRLRDPRRGRQGRRRQGRQDRLDGRHPRLQGRGGARHPGPGVPGLPHATRAARSARSR